MKFVADEFRLTDRLYVRISLKYKWFTDCDQDFPQIRRRRISLYLGPSISEFQLNATGWCSEVLAYNGCVFIETDGFPSSDSSTSSITRELSCMRHNIATKLVRKLYF